ncbi:MAG: DUF4271 domain-containing protein [Robiginitalea sp.]|jgi:hypothetical protein
MEALERTFESNDWITAVFLLSLLSLVFARAFFYNRFQNFIILPFNNKYIFLYNKKGRLVHGFHMVMTLFMFLNLCLYLTLVAGTLFPEEIRADGTVMLVIAAGLILLFAGKFLLQFAGGAILEFRGLLDSLIFKKMTYLNYSALLMFLANLLLGYVLRDSKIVVFTSLILILVINLIGWIGILKIHQKLIASHLFYFILYLCTLEIAPFLIISNLLKD